MFRCKPFQKTQRNVSNGALEKLNNFETLKGNEDDFSCRQRRDHFRHFEKLNVPGPKPSWIFGNSSEIRRNGLLAMQQEWHREFGPIIGYFMGKTPILAISDVELLKLIEIKDFMDFADRPVSFPPSNVHLLSRELDYR